MKNRKCSFTVFKEEEGNRREKTVTGLTLSDPFAKDTKKGTYMFVLVEEEETGEVHEVFANSIKFIK